MKNYESPTIEQAGGRGNEIKPQLVHNVQFVDQYNLVYYFQDVWETQKIAIHHLPTVLLVEF